MSRVLYLGENWFGSCARACCFALRRAGCDVLDIDIQTMMPQWRSPGNRVIARLLRPRIIQEYNDLILESAEHLRPDFLLAFKGSFVKSSTLAELRSSGIALYNYYPDTSPSAHGKLLAASIQAYDCIFYTKRFWATSPPKGLEGSRMVYVPHGYDPDVHRPLSLDFSERQLYEQRVLLIAGHTPEKERLLSALISLKPKINLHIYGPRWAELASSPNLRPYIRGVPLLGSQYAKAVAAAAICLGIMSGKVQGVAQGDETTTRSFEIPACGGFMLHERTGELLEQYKEGLEVACFGSVEELADKVDYYLAHPEERKAIARAGHLRCVPAYSYDRRMADILHYHSESFDRSVKNDLAQTVRAS
jgi:spore maturation protein CgeB